MIDFKLSEEMNPRNAARVIDHLREPRLWIPTENDYGYRHQEWLEKTESGLINGERHALTATFGRTVAGVVVFRVDPEQPTIVGVRNISINKDFRNRHVASFALRQAEIMAQEIYEDAVEVQVDTKTTNLDMIAFLESQHYTPKEIVDLYQSGKPDVVLTKDLPRASGIEV